MLQSDHITEAKPGLHEYWQIFLRRKWLIILPVVIIAAIAIPGSYLLPPVYQATTTLISQEVTRGSFIQDITRLNTPPGEQLSTIRYKILSRTYMRDVADKINIAQYLKNTGKSSGIDEEVRYLRNIVTIRPLGGMVIEISVMNPKPEMAKIIADTVANTYVERTLRWRQDSATDSTSFINQELETYKTKLHDAEVALVAGQEKGVLDSLSGENNTLVNEIAKIRANLVEVDLDLQEASNELSNARRMLSDNSITGNPAVMYVSDPEYNRLQTTLSDLQKQYTQLSMRYTDQHPQVTAIKNEITRVQFRLDQLRNSLSVSQQDVATRIQYWGDRVRTLGLKRIALADKLREYDQKLQQLPQRQLELARLQREKAAAESTYSMLLQRLNESDLLRSSELRNMGKVAEVLDPAIEPDRPIKPNKKKIAVLAIAFGIMLGFGSTFLLEYFDRSFHSVEDVVNYLGIPVIATIPRISVDDTIEKRFGKPITIAIIAIASLIVLIIFADIISAQFLMRNSLVLNILRRGLSFIRGI